MEGFIIRGPFPQYSQIRTPFSFSFCVKKLTLNLLFNSKFSVLSNFFYSLKTLSVLENWNKLSKKNQDQFVDGYFKSDYFLKSTKELYIHNNMIMVEDVIIYEDGIEEQINNILLKHELPTIKLNTIEV